MDPGVVGPPQAAQADLVHTGSPESSGQNFWVGGPLGSWLSPEAGWEGPAQFLDEGRKHGLHGDRPVLIDWCKRLPPA